MSAAQRDGMDTDIGLVYLVTGGSGFLGRCLVRMLLQRGDNVAEVRVFDLTVDRELKALISERLPVRLIQGDIVDAETVLEALRGADVVFHCASLIDISLKYPAAKIWAVNYQGTINVLNACKELGIRYLVYTSSMEVVGPNKMREPFLRGNEDTKYNSDVNGPYAQSKAAAEKLVLGDNGSKIAGGKVLVTCSLRPTGIYGEHNPIMELVYRSVMSFGGRRLRLTGREVEHGRVYVGNAAWMHILAARALRRDPALTGGEAYFCYDHSPYLSYEDFDRLLLEPVGVTLVGRRGPPLAYPLLRLLVMAAEALSWLLRPFVQLPVPLNRWTLAVITTPFTVSTNKAARHLGYQPLVPWGESRARTVAWLKSLGLEG